MDADAWMTSAFRVHGAALWRLIRRLGVPRDDVSDVVQAVFMVALSKREQIESGKEFAFLARTAVFEASHARRSLGRRREVLTDELVVADDGAPADEALHQQRARALLDAVLDRLPQEARVVFALHELEQLTLREIAEALEVPEGTVASRLRRARQLFEQEAKRVRARLARTGTSGDPPGGDA